MLDFLSFACVLFLQVSAALLRYCRLVFIRAGPGGGRGGPPPRAPKSSAEIPKCLSLPTAAINAGYGYLTGMKGIKLDLGCSLLICFKILFGPLFIKCCLGRFQLPFLYYKLHWFFNSYFSIINCTDFLNWECLTVRWL